MNKVALMGRLTRNPAIKNSSKGSSVASFTLAVPRKTYNNGKEETDYLNCLVFNKQADFTMKYLIQGSKILIVGRIENYSYTGKNRQSVSGVQIIVEELEFAESKSRWI